MLLKDGREKHLLKRLASRHIPESIVERSKFAFVAPGSPELLKQKLKWVEELLDPERIEHEGYFNAGTVQRLVQRNTQQGAVVNTTFEDDWLMIVLTFGLFLEEFDMPRLG